MHKTYNAILAAFSTFIVVSSVFALPYSDLNWGTTLTELKQFSHKNNMNCIVVENVMRYRCDSNFFGQAAKLDFYIDHKLGLHKLDYKIRIGNFRSGLAKSLDEDFRKVSRNIARFLIKRYGEANGYIQKKQLAYWNNLYKGETELKYWIQVKPYHLLRASYSSIDIQSQIEENELIKAIQKSR